MTRILLVSSGASWATRDVWQGVHDALIRQGVSVVQYCLEGRIVAAGKYLKMVAKQLPQGYSPPNGDDVIYLASQCIVERSIMAEPPVDWVLVISGTYIPTQVYDYMRRAGLRVAVILTESPYAMAQEIEIARRATLVWTNERQAVPVLGGYCPAYYWQHAMDPSRHSGEPDEWDDQVQAHDVVLVGTGWEERVELLKAIDWAGIDLGLYGAWKLIANRSRLRRYVKGGVVGNAVALALYRKAKIGLNLHRTSLLFGRGMPRIQGAESLNPRCYELAASGRFFVSDRRAELAEVFGGLVPTFDTPGQLAGLIRHYLAHDAEREHVAGQLAACVRGHTFDQRVAGMLSILEAYPNEITVEGMTQWQDTVAQTCA